MVSSVSNTAVFETLVPAVQLSLTTPGSGRLRTAAFRRSERPTSRHYGLRVMGWCKAVAMDMRRRRAGQMNLPRCRLCTQSRSDDGQTLSAERQCFQRRCQGGQLLSQVPRGRCGGSGLFGLNDDDPPVGDIRRAHSTFSFRLAPAGVTLRGRE